jgi:hypothetical protein
MGELVSGARNQPHTGTVPPRQNAEAVMLDFVQPSRAGRWPLGGRWQTRLDYGQAWAGTLTQRHKRFNKKGGPKSRVIVWSRPSWGWGAGDRPGPGTGRLRYVLPQFADRPALEMRSIPLSLKAGAAIRSP